MATSREKRQRSTIKSTDLLLFQSSKVIINTALGYNIKDFIDHILKSNSLPELSRKTGLCAKSVKMLILFLINLKYIHLKQTAYIFFDNLVLAMNKKKQTCFVKHFIIESQDFDWSFLYAKSFIECRPEKTFEEVMYALRHLNYNLNCTAWIYGYTRDTLVSKLSEHYEQLDDQTPYLDLIPIIKSKKRKILEELINNDNLFQTEKNENEKTAQNYSDEAPDSQHTLDEMLSEMLRGQNEDNLSQKATSELGSLSSARDNESLFLDLKSGFNETTAVDGCATDSSSYSNYTNHHFFNAVTHGVDPQDIIDIHPNVPAETIHISHENVTTSTSDIQQTSTIPGSRKNLFINNCIFSHNQSVYFDQFTDHLKYQRASLAHALLKDANCVAEFNRPDKRLQLQMLLEKAISYCTISQTNITAALFSIINNKEILISTKSMLEIKVNSLDPSRQYRVRNINKLLIALDKRLSALEKDMSIARLS